MCTKHKRGCPIQATSLFLSLGWDTTNANPPSVILCSPTRGPSYDRKMTLFVPLDSIEFVHRVIRSEAFFSGAEGPASRDSHLVRTHKNYDRHTKPTPLPPPPRMGSPPSHLARMAAQP